MDAVKNMNGTVWVFAVILIGMVVVQSLLFLRLALNFNMKNKVVTKYEISLAAKTGAVAAIGPALSTVTIALSLIVMVGSGATFLRCGVIGAPAWELMMAGISSQTVGVEFGTPEFTEAVFTLCIYGMTLASAPYFINTIITLKPLDKAAAKSAEKKSGPNFMNYVGNAAMMGLLGYSVIDYFKAIPSAAAIISAGITGYVLSQISKKTGNKTLASLSMAIGMIVAMVVGQVVTMIMA